MMAFKVATTIQEMTAAFGMAHDAASAFKDDELDSERQRLGELLVAALESACDTANADERLRLLRIALKQAREAAPIVKAICARFNALYRKAQAEGEELDRREARILVGAPAELPDPPHQFVCPITLQLMKDPTKAADGFTYERYAVHLAHTRSQSRRPPLLPS